MNAEFVQAMEKPDDAESEGGDSVYISESAWPHVQRAVRVELMGEEDRYGLLIYIGCV